jgi:hypothetical protein
MVVRCGVVILAPTDHVPSRQNSQLNSSSIMILFVPYRGCFGGNLGGHIKSGFWQLLFCKKTRGAWWGIKIHVTPAN